MCFSCYLYKEWRRVLDPLCLSSWILSPRPGPPLGREPKLGSKFGGDRRERYIGKSRDLKSFIPQMLINQLPETVSSRNPINCLVQWFSNSALWGSTGKPQELPLTWASELGNNFMLEQLWVSMAGGNMGSRAKSVKSQWGRLPAEWPRSSYFEYLCLSLLICEMGVTVLLTVTLSGLNETVKYLVNLQ